MNFSNGDEAKPGSVYEFGDFLLDPVKHELTRHDGTPVPLTPRVFDTLLFLVEHHGTTLDKERLMAAVWPDSIVEENNLTQNISTLRRLFGDTPQSHRFIVTVPGRGYRFAAEVKTPAGPKGAPPSSSKTLAVLPFKPLMPENSDPSLELGMADTLIARLSNLIVVRSLSAVRCFATLDPGTSRGRTEARSAISSRRKCTEEWQAAAGQRSAYESRRRKCLWAGTFDENFTDILGAQNAIAQRVVSALALPISREQEERLTKHETQSTEAYTLYLKGRYYWWKTTPEEFRKCRDYFQRAVDADPSYALGYCGLNSFFGYGSA